MNMMFKTISSALLILFLASGVLFAVNNEQTVPVDGEQLYNVLLTEQKKNKDAEDMVCNALAKIHIKDLLRVVPVNSKGETGAGVQPDLTVDGDKISLSIGAVLEFDINKYKQNVMTPLREVLKQVSTNGGKEIIPNVGDKIEGRVWTNYNKYPFQKARYNGDRMDGSYFTVILNVLQNPDSIFKSTYEGYYIKISPKMNNAFLKKMAEATQFIVHFVFKDEAGQEVFHERYWGMQSRENCNNIEKLKDIYNYCEFAMFIPWSGNKIYEKRSYLPLLISPEIYNRNDGYGYNKKLLTCFINAEAPIIKRIKSYEIFIEEATVVEK